MGRESPKSRLMAKAAFFNLFAAAEPPANVALLVEPYAMIQASVMQ